MRKILVMLVGVLVLTSGLQPASAIRWPTGAFTTQFGTRHAEEALAAAMNAVVGVTRTPSGEDGFLRYLGMHGATKWVVKIATEGDDRPEAVAQRNRRIYVAGTTTGAFAEGSNAGGTDVFVRAYSTEGMLKWSRQFGTPADDAAAAIGAGDLFGTSVTGWTNGDLDGPSAGGTDAFVLHLGAGGQVEWTTQFGSAADDRATCLDPFFPDVVCGSTTGTLPGQTPAGGKDAFAARIGQGDGSISWIRQLGTAADDAAAGVAEISSLDVIALGGTTEGVFPGATGLGGSDAFVAMYLDASDPTLQNVGHLGSAGNDEASGFRSSGGLFVLAGATDGTFPGNASAGGVDGWATVLDQPLYQDPWVGVVWTQQFGTAADEHIGGISGSLYSYEIANWTYVVGGTEGTFPGESSAGRSDAFWSFRFERNDSFAQDILLRALDLAQTFRADNAGSYDGFGAPDAAQMNPSYSYVDSPAEPQGAFQVGIADATGTTVRLVAYSKSGTYFCIEEAGGVVTYGHGSSYDESSCSGGWEASRTRSDLHW